MAHGTETAADCPECDWPMLHEDVQDAPDTDTTAGPRAGRPGHHEHVRCPNCGFVVEPAMSSERR
jgi:endogenous inhibitor of DNA gyrase (YacG/DUF329 family)